MTVVPVTVAPVPIGVIVPLVNAPVASELCRVIPLILRQRQVSWRNSLHRLPHLKNDRG